MLTLYYDKSGDCERAAHVWKQSLAEHDCYAEQALPGLVEMRSGAGFGQLIFTHQQGCNTSIFACPGYDRMPGLHLGSGGPSQNLPLDPFTVEFAGAYAYNNAGLGSGLVDRSAGVLGRGGAYWDTTRHTWQLRAPVKPWQVEDPSDMIALADADINYDGASDYLPGQHPYANAHPFWKRFHSGRRSHRTVERRSESCPRCRRAGMALD
jgi:hypothetical protein